MTQPSVAEIDIFGRILRCDAAWEATQAASAASTTLPWGEGVRGVELP